MVVGWWWDGGGMVVGWWWEGGEFCLLLGGVLGGVLGGGGPEERLGSIDGNGGRG